MKRLFALILVLLMVASLAVTAAAEEKTGSITIKGISEGNNYEIYKMLDLRYGESDKAFTYILPKDSPWEAFFLTDHAEYDANYNGNAYIAIDPVSRVATWAHANEDDSTKAAFAKLALAYAEKEQITADKSSTKGQMTITDTTGKFVELPLGYYLVDSTMGALCGLTTTAYDAEINAKNGAPTMAKWVQDPVSKQWVDATTAAMGDVIHYQVIIDANSGSQGFILHDDLGDGLTFKEVVKVEHVISATQTDTVGTDLYDVRKVGDSGFNQHIYNHQVTETETKTYTCDLEIVFDPEVCNKLEANHKLIVYYDVILNSDAKIHGEVNENTAWLSFGDPKENHVTLPSTVKTRTFFADILKTDSYGSLIDGAWFKIYDAANNGNEIKVVPDVYTTDPDATPLVGSDSTKPLVEKTENGDIPIKTITSYRLAVTDEEKANAVEIYAQNGKIKIYGLDAATYYLQETKEPSGYNPLTTRQAFTIVTDNLAAGTDAEGNTTIGYAVQVINRTGSNLPETGAMGTTMFITFGMFVMLGTGILLVTKKRMSMIED